MDPLYSGDLFFDGFSIKSEPVSMMEGVVVGGGAPSASVPIPGPNRRAFPFESSPSAVEINPPSTSLYPPWNQRIKMDDDDIFQVDKSDLIQGPTLAELNANDETLLEDLNFDDLLLPPENTCFIQVAQTSGGGLALSFPPDGAGFYSNVSGGSGGAGGGSGGKVLEEPPTPPPPTPPHPSPTLHHLLLKNNLDRSGGKSGRLCSSAPTHLGLDQIWQRREPRPHLLSTSSLAEATSTSSLSTGGVLSPEAHDFSLDEGFDSEDDSDHYEDFSSDGDSGSDGEGAGRARSGSSGSKREKYFWQYNVQAKGPKGQRLVLKTRQEDPHFLDEVTDPVFSPQCSLQGIKHSGKARKGDGNDLTPNPRKLCAIGKELDKLTRLINEMTPVSELPFNVRPKTRKEKNKLASRACRLKKKAQHEANKIKLYGLETEHKRLMNGISQMKQILISKVSAEPPDVQDANKAADKIVKNATKVKIAGQTTEFVNKVLDKVKSGTSSGGLEELHRA